MDPSTQLTQVTGPASTAAPDGAEPDSAAAYRATAGSVEFAALRRALLRFVFPVTVAFLAWYALYVLLSAYARGLMATKVVGNLNVALVFGLLQFASTFLIAWAYARYADRRIDPLARAVRDRMTGGGTGS